MSAPSFLSTIRDHDEGVNYAGSGQKHAAHTGLPDNAAGSFMFATGVECSYPTIDNGRTRRDQMRECGHYDRWREDLGLVRDMGLKVLRYGLPYYAVHVAPDRFDWGFADQAMAEIRRLGITPILDLLHFGLPNWLGDFQNPDLPIQFARYADAVAERYPWVRYYTPVNESYITARASAKDGLWNEQLKDDRAFVTATKNLVAANILASQAIVRRRPDAIIVHSESAEYIHEACALQTQAVKLANKQRFISLDLLYAHPPDADVMLYLLDSGLTREEYDWFMQGEPPGYQILGNDYYGRNEHILKPDGTMCPAEDVAGWYQITKEYYARYKKPVMHTETNVSDPDAASSWLWKQWVNVLKMRADGVPVLGFTWYSLTDQIDWDIALAEVKGVVNACGLYDLDRKPRLVEGAYRMLLQEFGQLTMVPHAELFAVTSEASGPKVEV